MYLRSTMPLYIYTVQAFYNTFQKMGLCIAVIDIRTSNITISIYRLLKYQLKANPFVSTAYGVGTSPKPGRATGCRK